MEEEVDLVDENDEVIGQTTKNEVHDKILLHRVVHGVVRNSEGKIFLVKRAPTRKHGPNLFDASVGGHVKKDESYEDAIKREGQEELGIEGEWKFALKHIPGHPLMKHVVSVFMINHDGPIELCEREFSEGKWMDLDEILKNAEEKFTPDYYRTLIKISKKK